MRQTTLTDVSVVGQLFHRSGGFHKWHITLFYVEILHTTSKNHARCNNRCWENPFLFLSLSLFFLSLSLSLRAEILKLIQSNKYMKNCIGMDDVHGVEISFLQNSICYHFRLLKLNIPLVWRDAVPLARPVHYIDNGRKDIQQVDIVATSFCRWWRGRRIAHKNRSTVQPASQAASQRYNDRMQLPIGFLIRNHSQRV